MFDTQGRLSTGPAGRPIELDQRIAARSAVSRSRTAGSMASNKLTTSAVVEEALAKHGKPEIFNSDQGSRCTSVAFADLLKKHEIAISMDGKGAWRDNVFVERLWRTIKYEEVYLRAYTTCRTLGSGPIKVIA